MKILFSFFVLLSSLFSVNAFALNCPSLVGAYSCILAEYPTVHEDLNIKLTDKELTINADTFLADGKPHRGAFGIRYMITCDAKSLYFSAKGPFGQNGTVIYSPTADEKLIVMRTESTLDKAKLEKTCERK